MNYCNEKYSAIKMAAVLARDCIKYWKWPSIDISSISDTLKKSEIYLPFNMVMSQEPVGKYIRRKQHITSLSPSVHFFFCLNCCLHCNFLCLYRSYATAAGTFSCRICLYVDPAKHVLGTSSAGNIWKHQFGLWRIDSPVSASVYWICLSVL